MHALPPITRNLLLANGALFALQILGLNDLLTMWFALWPLDGPFMPWQVVTYGFLHGGLAHIFFNMFGVFMFGSEIERTLGSRRYMVLYFASVIVAGFTQILVNSYLMPSPYPTLGASGGVFGLLIAFALLFPNQRIQLLFPPIPMRAWVFVTLYGLLELYLGFARAQSGVAHFAHLGGMLGGYLAIRHFRRSVTRG
jgi:membrane associated rhomboid family serine protease